MRQDTCTTKIDNKYRFFYDTPTLKIDGLLDGLDDCMFKDPLPEVDLSGDQLLESNSPLLEDFTSSNKPKSSWSLETDDELTMSGSSYTRPAPAVDVIPSEELLTYIHPFLSKLDFTDTTVKAACIAGTSVTCIVMFVFFHIFGKIFLPFYRALPSKHKTFMCLAIIRGCYGLYGIVFGGYCLLAYTNLDRDVVFGRTATSTLSMYVTVGFFIFELSAVVISDMAFGSFSKMLIVHHGLGLISYIIAVQGQENFSFGTKALVLEMSTPFSCLCYVLLKAGKEKSVLWKLNQIILVHTFHLRSVVECYLWYLTYKNWDYIIHDMPASSFYLLYITLSMVTFVMTPYWGYKKTQQLFNPVDWNFQESRNTDAFANSNGNAKKIV